MGQLCMILGPSGSGKSTSLRNFGRDEIGIFNVAGKRLPFRGDLPLANNVGYDQIRVSLGLNRLRAYAIDDATYLMEFDNFARAQEKGYEKFVDMAVSFNNLLRAAMATDDDTIVYFLMHPELDARGDEKVKSVGKMLDEKLVIEGLFPIVLDARAVRENNQTRHVFVTQNDGHNLAKSPMGMFGSDTIDNDLKDVDSIIRNYWGMAPIKKENENA